MERKLRVLSQILSNPFLLIYAILWLYIGAVSTLDVVYTIALQEHLILNEENPFARVLLSEDNWQISRFIGLKMYGTIMVLGFLVWIYNRNKKFACLIISTISFLQFLLMLYLLN